MTSHYIIVSLFFEAEKYSVQNYFSLIIINTRFIYNHRLKFHKNYNTIATNFVS